MMYTINDMIALMCDKDTSYMGKCVGVLLMLGFDLDDIRKEWKIPQSSIQQCLRCNPSIKELFINQLREKVNTDMLKMNIQPDMGLTEDDLGPLPNTDNIDW